MSKDTDEDSKEAKEAIYKWVKDSEFFEISTKDNELVRRYDMCHIISPTIFKEKMGYHLSEVYVPIVVKS